MEGPKGGHWKENGLVKDVSQCEHKKSTSYLALLISPASLAFASSVEFVTHLKLRQTNRQWCMSSLCNKIEPLGVLHGFECPEVTSNQNRLRPALHML